MAKINFKPQQLDIISSEGKNLLVSASAGSGKTTVMISKILSILISQKAHVENLLVLTYTSNAANEMKQKLLNSLKENVAENPNLEDEIENLDMADISTIHSFCQRLIKKHFHILDSLDPSFNVLTNEKRALLKTKAISAVMETYKEEMPFEYLSLIKLYGKNRNDDKIIDIIYKIDDFLEANLDKTKFRNQTAFILYENKELVTQILNNSVCQDIKYHELKFVKLYEKSKNLSLQKTIEITEDVLFALKQIDIKNTFENNIKLLENFSFKRNSKDKENEEFSEEVITAKKEVKEYIDSIKKKDYSNEKLLSEGFEETKQILSQFTYLHKKYEEKYKELKKQNNSLDFSDLERHAIKLTSNLSLQKELKEKFKYIFIDEFQDANEVQQTLINNIAEINNRFMVGDVKQSIYGFRRSNPQIFLSLQKDYETDINSSNKSLNLNFRSDESILHFVNSIFQVIMTTKTADIDYKSSGMFNPEKVLPKAKNPRVKINIIKNQKIEKEQTKPNIFSVLNQDDSYQEDEKAAEKEAIQVASDIFLLKQEQITENSKQRNVKFSDMTILFRKRGEFFETFCNKLTQLGIPINANSSKSIFEEPDIKKLITLLKLSQNIFDDFSLASVMLGSIGNFTHQELTDIKLENMKEKFFYNCVINYSKINQNALATKIKNFFELINDFTNQVQTKGVFLALNEILDKTQYRSKIYPLKQGEQRVGAIEKFVQIFAENEFNYNLNAFFKLVDLKNNEIKSPSYTFGDSDCVNITTIHASKGLEYPIVFVVDTSSDLTRTPNKAEIRLSDKYGIGLKYYDEEKNKKYSSLIFDVIEKDNAKEEFAEKLRLLYVALTRAKEFLYVYASVKKTDNIESFSSDYQVINSKTYFDLIMGSFSKDNLEKIKQNKIVEVYEKDAVLSVETIDEESENEVQEENIIKLGKGDKTIIELLKQNIFYTYPKPEVYSVALKNSVSFIAKHEDYESINTVPKNLTIQEHLNFDNTNAETGIIYHKIFEKIDYEKDLTESYIKELIQKFVETDLQSPIDSLKILKSCLVIKELLEGQKAIREKKFMMKVPYSSVTPSTLSDEILVQGIIDLYSFGKRNLLIDYKLTNLNSDEKIIERYKKQIELYKMALSLAFKKDDIECYIIDINRGRAINIK